MEAQGWSTQYFDGDELTKKESYEAYSFINEKGDQFVYWSNSDKNFRIINNSINAPFKDLLVHVPLTLDVVRVMKHVKVGFYDENGKLIDSDDTEMIVQEGKSNFASVPGKKVAKKIIKFIASGKPGYVRIVAPLYGSNIPFDIKITSRKIK